MPKKTTLYSLLWMLPGFAAISIPVFFLFFFREPIGTIMGAYTFRSLLGIPMQFLLCGGLGWLLAKRGFSLHWSVLLAIPAVLLLYFQVPGFFWRVSDLFTGSDMELYQGFASLPLWKQQLLTNVLSVWGLLTLEAGLGCLAGFSRLGKAKSKILAPAAE